jgi:hypothetical protein
MSPSSSRFGFTLGTNPVTHLAPSGAELERPPGDCEAGRNPRVA